MEAVLDATDRTVLSGSENGYVYAWDLVEGSLLAKLEHTASKNEAAATGSMVGELMSGSSLTVHSLSFHPSRAELLTAARGNVYMWKGQSLMEEDE